MPLLGYRGGQSGVRPSPSGMDDAGLEATLETGERIWIVAVAVFRIRRPVEHPEGHCLGTRRGVTLRRRPLPSAKGAAQAAGFPPKPLQPSRGAGPGKRKAARPHRAGCRAAGYPVGKQGVQGRRGDRGVPEGRVPADRKGPATADVGVAVGAKKRSPFTVLPDSCAGSAGCAGSMRPQEYPLK